jgi:hypothetical protein
MTTSPEHVDLHRMVDRLDPDQFVRCVPSHSSCYAPTSGTPTPARPRPPEPESLLSDEPVRDFSFIGLFNGAPDLAERSEEILR